jgi:hypothetical protein
MTFHTALMKRMAAFIEARDPFGDYISENDIAALETEAERLRAENERLRDNIVQQSRKYEADMKVMQLALNREIEARRALEPKP